MDQCVIGDVIMKAYVGPRVDDVSMNHIFNKWLEFNHKCENYYFIDENDHTKMDRMMLKICDYIDEKILSRINKFRTKRGRKVRVKLHEHDTDVTFIVAAVAFPLIEKVRHQGMARPFVPNEDVPARLHADIDEDQYELTDEEENLLQKRWDYVLSRMSFAFRLLTVRGHSFCDESEACDDGLRLFAKYYHALYTYRT